MFILNSKCEAKFGIKKKSQLLDHLRHIGPGIVMAATGIGVGDLVATAVAGSRFGYSLIWAVIAGVVIKYFLSEGVARWQLATGTTLFEGWSKHFGRPVQLIFLVYLFLWSWIAGGALLSACGMVANALIPSLSVQTWGILHSAFAAACAVGWSYRRFERVMEVILGFMFFVICGCAFYLSASWPTVYDIVSKIGLPIGSAHLALGVMGGIGGSLTLLSYGYWIREREWKDKTFIPIVRVDLAVTYGMTAALGVGSLILAARGNSSSGIPIQGTEDALSFASSLEGSLGQFGKGLYLMGFWATAIGSLLGTWQSVPYLFADFIQTVKGNQNTPIDRRSNWYRGFLVYLSFTPILTLYLARPVSVILFFTLIASLFIPFLSGTLLIMNSKTSWVGKSSKSHWTVQVVLLSGLILFTYLCWSDLPNIF